MMALDYSPAPAAPASANTPAKKWPKPSEIYRCTDLDAALALITFASMSRPQSRLKKSHMLQAGRMVASLLVAAAAGGFAATDEFWRLVGTGNMPPELDALAYDAVACIGGPAVFFGLLDQAVAPAAPGGVQ